MRLRLLSESGLGYDTLEKNKVNLTDEERKKVMDAKAVWNFGPKGAPSPAIKKAIIDGKTYYYCATHRCYQSAKTLDAAINKFFKTVEPSA
jgi:YHS domain-containing protein